jgi:hypothetical protein
MNGARHKTIENAKTYERGANTLKKLLERQVVDVEGCFKGDTSKFIEKYVESTEKVNLSHWKCKCAESSSASSE